MVFRCSERRRGRRLPQVLLPGRKLYPVSPLRPIHLLPIKKSTYQNPTYWDNETISRWRPWVDMQESISTTTGSTRARHRLGRHAKPYLLEVMGSGILVDMAIDAVKGMPSRKPRPRRRSASRSCSSGPATSRSSPAAKQRRHMHWTEVARRPSGPRLGLKKRVRRGGAHEARHQGCSGGQDPRSEGCDQGEGGKPTNDPDLESEGALEKVAGRVQHKIGQVKKVLGT